MSRQLPGGTVRLGMITPSSNTVLEPVCAALLAGQAGVSAHFARVRVLQIGLSAASAAQFAQEPMLAAADLLMDANMHALCWNGTSASWLGLERDRALCAAIEQRWDVPATSATLATIELLRRHDVRSFGLVTPYTTDVQDAIIATFKAEGFACVAERHAGLSGNFAFASLAGPALQDMVRACAAAPGVQAVCVLCTNVDASALAAPLEREFGIPVLDSTACAVWGALDRAGAPPALLRDWSRAFAA